MKRLILYPYDIASGSAIKIQSVLKGLRVHPDGKYKVKKNDFLVNWGNSNIPKWLNDRPILNHPSAVANAINKIKAFEIFAKENVPCPLFTTSWEQAYSWFNDGQILVGREKVTGKGGEGALILIPDENMVFPNKLRLYTQYKKKRAEYRVHVFQGEVIDVVQKRKKTLEHNNGVEPDRYIRSHDRGWVFARSNLSIPEDLHSVAIAAIQALKLDFGAADIIWNEKENKCFVLEVNSAPGIEATSLNIYCDRIGKCLN